MRAALALGLSIAHHQASAAADTPDTTEADPKGMFVRWLLSHGQGGAIVVGFVLAGLGLLSQAQNIESTFRMLGPHFRRWLGSRKPQPEPPPPPSPLLTKLPSSRKGFLARSAELQQLATELAPEAARVVIHGMPGVGKSSLALHYAHSASTSHPGGAWWLSASEGFDPMVLEAVSELEVRIPGLGRVEGLSMDARLRRCFEAWPGGEGEPVLLVVDNLPSPEEGGVAMVERLTTGLPRRFRCLFTQRALPPKTISDLKLPVFDREEDALELLKIRSGAAGHRRIEQEAEDAARLVEAVGRLPLALVLLAGRLQRVPTLRVAELLEDLSKHALRCGAFQEKSAMALAEIGMEATLHTSWDPLGPEAMELARLLSLTLQAPIPWELISRCVPPEPAQSEGRPWEEGLAELVGANLLEGLEGDLPLYGLHPLLREFFASQRLGWEPEPHWRREMGAAAQALAMQWENRDLVMAVEYWRQTIHAQPDDISAAYSLGNGFLFLGDTAAAKEAFERCLRNAQAADDSWSMSCAWEGIGDVLVSRGDGKGALAAYQAGLTIREDLMKRDPTNSQWQQNLSIILNKIGDMLLDQGNDAVALAAFQIGLSIAEELANRDPANTVWQRHLSICNVLVGDVLLRRGDGAGALAAYQTYLMISEDLAKRDPANTEWQRDLVISHNKIGDVLVAQGDGPGSLSAYQAGLMIAEDLAKRYPANTRWQRDLSISHERIADVLLEQGNGSGALASYQACLTIREDLAKRDPANIQWQRDLSISHTKIGDVLMAQGDGPASLAAYQAGLAIAEDLAKRDPANKQWQRDLSISQSNVADVLMAQGDGPAALKFYQAVLAINEDLAKRDPTNTEWQRDLFLSHKKIGNVLVSLRDGSGAMAAYQAGLMIAEHMAKRDPANAEWQRDLSVSHNDIGDVLQSQGDGPGALAAYQACLRIREGLAMRDPANTQLQVDLAMLCGKLGTLKTALPIKTRRTYLKRGLTIILALKQAGRLHANEDRQAMFERDIRMLDLSC